MIKILAMDVDGTLTDGKIYMGPEGEVMKAFDVRDGYGIANLLPRCGIVPVIITGRSSRIVEQRAKELKITELHQGISEKLRVLEEVACKYGVTLEQAAYIGDDLNDLDCIRACGCSGCPADAVEKVLQASNYVCRKNGGNGAVREFIEYLVERL